MARALNLYFDEKSYNLSLQKVDRKKIYGYTVIEVKDDNNLRCSLASISDDGKYILSKGSIGNIAINSQNEYISTKDIKMVDINGKEIDKIPSSFDLGRIELQKSSLEEYFQLQVKAVYQMNPEDKEFVPESLLDILQKEKVLRFKFNYRTDYNDDDAFLIQNEGTVFMVTGQFIPYEFIGLEKTIESPIIEDEEDDDDFDFGML